MLGGDMKWNTQSTNNFTGVRNEQHGSFAMNPRETDITGVSGGPVKSVGGNVGGISVSGREFVPCRLQQSYLDLN